MHHWPGLLFVFLQPHGGPGSNRTRVSTFNGKEALELIQRRDVNGNAPSLILLDINVPVMNGFDLMLFAQKQSMVIVVLTTSLNPNDVSRLRQMPIRGFQNKPLTKQVVMDLSAQHFNQDLPT